MTRFSSLLCFDGPRSSRHAYSRASTGPRRLARITTCFVVQPLGALVRCVGLPCGAPEHHAHMAPRLHCLCALLGGSSGGLDWCHFVFHPPPDCSEDLTRALCGLRLLLHATGNTPHCWRREAAVAFDNLGSLPRDTHGTHSQTESTTTASGYTGPHIPPHEHSSPRVAPKCETSAPCIATTSVHLTLLFFSANLRE